MSKRVEKLREAMKELGVDAFLTENEINRRYLSGFTGTAGWLIVTMDDAALLTDFRYIDQATEQAAGFRIVNTQRKAISALQEEFGKLGVKKAAIESQLITLATYEEWKEAFSGVELVKTSGVVEKLRMYKDDEELAIVSEAVRIADEAFSHILSYIRPGVRELDVAMELEFTMRKLGASSSSFDIIVASGYRGALPHGVASEKVIEAGEMVTLDFGALYKGYASDLTRTVAVGEPHPEMRKIYEIVLQAQLAGLQMKPGMSCKEADALTRDVITAAGYGEHYGHSAGHGLGLLVHELPNLSAASKQVLEPGMLVTMEPGIYVSGLGGVRIEDDVLITQDGCRILNKSTKELLILPV